MYLPKLNVLLQVKCSTRLGPNTVQVNSKATFSDGLAIR